MTFTSFKLVIAAVIFATIFTFGGNKASAQDLFTMNAQADAQFYNWAYQQSWRVARELPNNVTSSQIINAMQPHTVDNTYGNYNRNWWNNQNRTTNSVENYSRGAIRGEATFYDYNGNSYYLPYNAGGYHYGNNGYIYEGHGDVDYGQNLYYR